MGILPTRAEDLIKEYSPQLIEAWIEAVKIKDPDSPGGYLITALAQKWELPKGIKKKIAKETEEAEEELRARYNRYVWEEVNTYLGKIDPEQIRKEIDEYWPVFFNKLPEHFKTDLSEEYLKKQCEHDYRMDKAKSLSLPSFEEWKSKRD